MEEVTKDLVWLNSKWWYRTLKVVFIIASLLSMVVVYVVAWSSRPKKNPSPNEKTSYFTCNSGDSYFFESINGVGSINMDYEINTANYICETGISPLSAPTIINPTPKFVVTESYDSYGSWKDVVTIWFGGGIILSAIAWVLRGIFFYIVCGKFNPNNNRKIEEDSEKSL